MCFEILLFIVGIILTLLGTGKKRTTKETTYLVLELLIGLLPL